MTPALGMLCLVLYLIPIAFVGEWMSRGHQARVLSLFGFGVLFGSAMTWGVVLYLALGGKL